MADPGCGGGANTGNFRIVIDCDGAVTDQVLSDATVECAESGALREISSSDPFTFRIPESYWSQWSLADAQECFGGSLGFGSDAQVTGFRIEARDHHGAPDHWSVQVDYNASSIGTTAIGTHHANIRGECLGSCPDLPPAERDTNTYDMGYLTRTQQATRTKRLSGERPAPVCLGRLHFWPKLK